MAAVLASGLASGPCALLGGAPAFAAVAEVLANPPHALSVTVYRAPSRESGSIDLDDLEGFALVTEARTVHLPAGLSRLRFEGVADGIQPVSAIVSGLPDGVIEKNRDARLLSPSALIAATVGKPVELQRTNRNTGEVLRLTGKLVSDADGVVFESAQGIEALRCSGFPETFRFDPPADLSARPTLSVLVKSATAVTRQVTLSYLATGFDWAATYTATLSPDGKTLDLGAWVTLANGNATGFPQAHTQVVAGRLNRENDEVEPIELGTPIIAQCWPRGSTSDSEPGVMFFKRSMVVGAMNAPAPAMMAGRLEEVIVTGAKKVQQEQLGDLKLYRVPDRTTVAARQSKQVRLMDRSQIPVKLLYGFSVAGGAATGAQPARRWLRTRNTAANHLGLPLPSGSVDVYSQHRGGPLLEHESELPDLAVDEEVEIPAGVAADVEVEVHDEDIQVDSAGARQVPLLPGVTLRSVKAEQRRRVDITNAQPREVEFELQLLLRPGERVTKADRPPGSKNGRPLFRLKIPAEGSTTLHYRTRRVEDSVGRTP